MGGKPETLRKEFALVCIDYLPAPSEIRTRLKIFFWAVTYMRFALCRQIDLQVLPTCSRAASFDELRLAHASGELRREWAAGRIHWVGVVDVRGMVVKTDGAGRERLHIAVGTNEVCRLSVEPRGTFVWKPLNVRSRKLANHPDDYDPRYSTLQEWHPVPARFTEVVLVVTEASLASLRTVLREHDVY